MLSLEDAHWRLSALPGMCAGFSGRGVIREGALADIVTYNYEKLVVRPMEIAHDLPGGEWRRVRKADGYRYIMVNGEITMRDGEQTGAARAGCCATATAPGASVRAPRASLHDPSVEENRRLCRLCSRKTPKAPKCLES